MPGLLGCFPLHIPIQRQSSKRVESFIVSDPIILTTAHTVGDAQEIIEQTGSSGILILDRDKRLAGIVTTRD